MEFKHFFIAGAQRSGTTYLYHLCAEHPQIEMAQPVKPEPKFFMIDALYERGLEYYKSAFFKGKPKVLIQGEKSTSYIEVEKAAQRIARHFPEGKIIFILRNPVERAISNYWFSVKNGFEKLSIEEAFLKEENRRQSYDTSKVSVSPYAYLWRGRYIEFLEMYERYFPAEQIYVILHEQIINSEQYLRDFYAYLGVNPTFVPTSLHTIINANENKPAKEIDPQLRKYLENYFAEFNARLSKRLGLSLAEWQ
jgi:hypothetical protein